MAGDRALPRPVGAQRHAQAWDGDRSGEVDWGYLYEQHAQPLRTLIARRVPNREPVEDILHETFARAIRSTHLIDTDRPPWPFLATVAGRAVADWWSRDHGLRPVEPPVHAATEDYPGSDAHALRLDRVVGARRALLALTPRHRRVLYRYEGEGWSYAALTEAEQVSVQAMKSLLGRARSCFHARYREFVAGDAALGVLVGLRVVLSRLRRRLDRWQDGRGWEGLAAVGGLVVAGAIIGGATSPVVSAPATDQPRSTTSLSAPVYAPSSPVIAESAVSSETRDGSGGSVLVDRQQEEAAPPSSPPPPRWLDAGGGIVNGTDSSTASFYVVVGNPALGNEKQIGTNIRCDEGELAARKCQVIRFLPGSS